MKPRRLGRLAVLPPLAALVAGCATPVTGRIQPLHFQFTTVNPQRKSGPGGWRAACVHAQVKNGTTGERYTCQFGVEMPIENEEGPISLILAQRVAAECANEAAYTVLTTLTSPTPLPLYTLCTEIRAAYGLRLSAAIIGSRVMATCDPRTKPVIFGVSTP